MKAKDLLCLFFFLGSIFEIRLLKAKDQKKHYWHTGISLLAFDSPDEETQPNSSFGSKILLGRSIFYEKVSFDFDVELHIGPFVKVKNSITTLDCQGLGLSIKSHLRPFFKLPSYLPQFQIVTGLSSLFYRGKSHDENVYKYRKENNMRLEESGVYQYKMTSKSLMATTGLSFFLFRKNFKKEGSMVSFEFSYPIYDTTNLEYIKASNSRVSNFSDLEETKISKRLYLNLAQIALSLHYFF